MGWTWIKKCPVFCVLAVSGLFFSLVGIIGKFTMYRGYEFHVAKQPFLALVMEGIDEGVAPWEVIGINLSGDLIPFGKEGKGAEADGRGQDIEDFIGTDSGTDNISAGGIYAEGAGAAPGSGTGNGAAGAVSADAGPDSGFAAGRGDGSGTGGGNISGFGTGGGNISGSGADGGSITGFGTNGANASGSGMGGGNILGFGMDGANTSDSGTGGSQPGNAGAGMAGELAEGAEGYGFQGVPEEYFNDAVFIGDSRTVGLYEYGGIEMRADFFAKISLTIYDVFTEKVATDEETGKKITVEDALQKKQYGKVYLMLGINELGTGTTEGFLEAYRAVVARIRELQPDAVIFVEGIMRVTGTKNESDPIFNNSNINDKNEAISGLADNRDVFYIDVNEVVCDENGNLNAEYTTDEVHLKAKYYGIWKEFLLAHGIIRG